MDLRSSAFTDHTPIPGRYARDGDNVSPPLEWSEVPDGTAELALICEDPDAPRGTFVHWLVAGISTSTASFSAGETPQGTVLGRNDFGGIGWDGPQPPAGDPAHRYFFRLHALPEPTGLATGFSADQLRKGAEAGELASATLVGLYQR